jgi:hypothetical protein
VTILFIVDAPAAFAMALCSKYKVKRDSGQAAIRRSDTSLDLERRGGLI